MKKTLVAFALAGAFAGSAMAADFDVYGVVDYAFVYDHTSNTTFKGVETSDDSFGLQAGYNYGSRFGFKGVEDLGNGMKIGFKLENGFNADDGTLGNGGRLFGREASAHLYTDYGTFSFGRMGGVASSLGTYDVVYVTGDAFDGGSNGVLGFAISDRYDNMVAYQSPEFSGMKVTAMYSFKENNKDDKDGEEGSHHANRYAGFALNGNFGPVQAVAAYEMEMYNDKVFDSEGEDADHGHTFYIGGNYDAGFAKFFAMGQYFQNVRKLSANGFAEATADLATIRYDGVKGYGLHVGAQTTIATGLLKVGAYYVDSTGENADLVGTTRRDMDADYIGLAVRYEYPLSNRTFLYTGAGYGKTSVDAPTATANYTSDFEDELTHVYVGMTHKF